MADAIQEIADLTKRFLAETMTDPDLAARSEDYREGYRRGFIEALEVAILLRQKALQTHGK